MTSAREATATGRPIRDIVTACCRRSSKPLVPDGTNDRSRSPNRVVRFSATSIRERNVASQAKSSPSGTPGVRIRARSSTKARASRSRSSPSRAGQISASVVMTGEPWSVAARPPMTTYRTAWRSSAAMISAGWNLVSTTRGQTPDRSRRCDEGNPARESLQALVGRETQALLDEAPVVGLGIPDLSTQSVPDRGLVGAGVLSHGASVLQAPVPGIPRVRASSLPGVGLGAVHLVASGRHHPDAAHELYAVPLSEFVRISVETQI